MRKAWALYVIIAIALVGCGTGERDGSGSTPSEPSSTAEVQDGFPATGTSPATGSSSPAPAATPSRPPEFEPFPERYPDGSIQRDTCGTYTVVRERAKGPSGGQAQDRITLLNQRGQKSAELSATGPLSLVGVDWCFDLTNDGAPELSIFSYSGGAHCCITQSVYTLGSERATNLFDFEAGNAGALTPADLDGKQPLELVGVDDRFANFADLPYVSSPFIVLVMAQRGSEWAVATRDFPEVIRGHRDGTIAQRGICERDNTQECWRGLGLGIMAESLLLGDWNRIKGTLGLPPEAIFWLELQLGAVQARLAEQ